MDRSLQAVNEKRMEAARKALGKNNMQAFCAKDRREALAFAQTFLPEGAKVAVGGSVTLRQTGIQQLIETGNYRYTSRYLPGTFDMDPTAPEEQIAASYIDAYTADVYFTSSNAVTMSGELVNVDGQGNRISAMIYGPKTVVVVAGWNKLVKDIPAAIARIETIAAPANNLRHQNGAPCCQTGACVRCSSDARACCSYGIMAWQRNPERVKVVLVAETLGY